LVGGTRYIANTVRLNKIGRGSNTFLARDVPGRGAGAVKIMIRADWLFLFSVVWLAGLLAAAVWILLGL
jgi:hypothetical protein